MNKKLKQINMSKKETILNVSRDGDLKKNVSKRSTIQIEKKRQTQNDIFKEISPNSNVKKIKKEISKNTPKKEEKIEKEKNETPKNIMEDDNNISNYISDLNKIGNNYNDKIKALETKIQEMDSQYVDEIKKYKKEIDTKEKDIKKLIVANENLKKSLEILTQRLDKLLLNSTNQKMKYNNNISKNAELEHKLEIKEKELKNQQQLINILTRDNKNIREKLGKFETYSKDVDLPKLVHELYQKNISLESKFKEFKENKNNSEKIKLEKNLREKSNNSMNNTRSNNEFSFRSKNKKFILQNNKKSRSIDNFDKNEDEETQRKKYKFSLNIPKINKKSSEKNELDIYIEKSDMVEKFGGVDTLDSLQKIYDDDFNFFKKLVSYDKVIKSKINNFESTIRHNESNIKTQKEKITEMETELNKKTKLIKDLSKQNEKIATEKEELTKQLLLLYKEFTVLEQTNKDITEKNQEYESSLFCIDGIIEATSKDGNKIPIIKKFDENKENSTIIKEEKKDKDNDSIKQSSSRDTKNKIFSENGNSAVSEETEKNE